MGDREEVVEDSTKLKFAWDRGGEQAMVREMITLFRPMNGVPCTWSVPEGILGWEFHSKASVGGLHTQHRSICYYGSRDGESTSKLPLTGPWRASYQRVEDELLQHFRVYDFGGGLKGEGVAKVQAFVSNLLSSTRLPGM